MKKNDKSTTSGGNRKLIALLALLLARSGARAGAEEVTGTILFEPRTDPHGICYIYSLFTTANSKLCDIGFEITCKT